MAKKVEEVAVTRHEDSGEASRPLRVPAVDIEEQTDEYVLTAEMPGVARDGAEVTVEEGVLLLRGRTRQDVDPEPEHVEFHAGDFERRFRILPDIDPGRIAASMKDGVLTVRLAKQEKAKVKKITVESSE
ncbi:MAG: Hsp20/alpha crystallin family protein [Planctomycetota bacterium]